MPEFSEAYKKLNERQKEAVDTIEGPLLVIAGPGTGKTQLLSLRVANILRTTDASPENILCLTFTNKASVNMRERLTSLVGPEGNRVPIHTFHSFAAKLMDTYPEYFWNGARLTHVPDAVQLDIITEILSQLPLDNPLALKFAGNFTSLRDVQEGLKLAKEAGLTPGKLQSLIELNLSYIDTLEPRLIEICSERLSYKKLPAFAQKVAELPPLEIDTAMRPLVSLSTVIRESFERAYQADEGTNKTTNISKWKSRWISTVNGEKGMFMERKRNQWWHCLAEVYEKYRSHLHARGYYDYADMIIEVASMMEQHPDMLASIQEQTTYVLIDEFQDTNAAQLRLAHLVADHYLAEDKPNLMVVGDDDQAIYKFNGAELSNILDFRRSYKSAKVVVLTDNYRSSEAVLRLSGQLIEQASERVSTRETDIQKTLYAKNSPDLAGVIEHLSYPTALHQYYAVAKKIDAAFKSKKQSIAVLARNHESLRSLAAILQKQGTPVWYEQQQSIFDQELVQQVILVARIACASAEGNYEMVNQYTAKLLCHEAWGIPTETLWQLAIQNRYQPDWLDSLLKSKDKRQQNTGQWLLWLGRESNIQPLPRMLEYIIGLSASEHMTSPLRKHFLELQAIDTPFIAGLSGLYKLVNLAEQFCTHGHATLQNFIQLIDTTTQNNQHVTDESLFVSAKHAVELLTVYKAKGLEFDTVFIIDAQESIWQPKNNGRKPPANLPLRPNGDDLDDYIRLLFVAVTRAKHSVCVTSYYTNGDGESVLPSGIIRDILPARKITPDEAGDPAEILERSLTWPHLSGSKEKLLLEQVLQEFKLSVTSFVNFLDVSKGGPQYFLERHLLRLPEALSPQLAFGSAVHQTLEYAQILVCEGKYSLQEILNTYERMLSEAYLSRGDHERYLLHGKLVLRRLFEEYQLELRPDGRPEVTISDIHIAHARIHGKLDRVDVTDGSVLITDYKTGAPLSSFTTKNKLLALKAWRYRTQLQFYTLLAQHSYLFKNSKSWSAQMLYVEAETANELIREYTPSAEELDRLRALVAVVWEKIASYNLPDTRHYDASYQGIVRFEQDLLDGKI